MDALEQLSTVNLIAQAYGFAIGTVLATLLLILVWRSGGTDRRPRFLFAACILIANASGLAKNLVLALDASHATALAWQIRSIGFIAAAFAGMNVVGGYVVTDRMLGMFRKRPVAPPPAVESAPVDAASVTDGARRPSDVTR